jgi:hypothetical protein
MKCECLIELITLLVTFAGFVITIYTIKKSRADLRIKNALELKKNLNDFREINHKLFPGGAWNQNGFNFNQITNAEFSDFNSYLGYFEISKFMLDNGSLSKREFRTFFYYRLSNIAYCTAAMENIQDNIDSWRDLIALMQMFDLPVEDNN